MWEYLQLVHIQQCAFADNIQQCVSANYLAIFAISKQNLWNNIESSKSKSLKKKKQIINAEISNVMTLGKQVPHINITIECERLKQVTNILA